MMASVSDAATRMQRLRSDTAAAGPGPSARSFLRWLLDDPWSRTVSPQSTVTVSDYLRERLCDVDLHQRRYRTRLTSSDIDVRARLEEAFGGHPLLRRADEPCAKP
jgi:hypothetical protein